MNDRYTKSAGRSRTENKGDWTPRVDIAEVDKGFIIKSEIHEVNMEDVKIVIENGILTIRGER